MRRFDRFLDGAIFSPSPSAQAQPCMQWPTEPVSSVSKRCTRAVSPVTERNDTLPLKLRNRPGLRYLSFPRPLARALPGSARIANGRRDKAAASACGILKAGCAVRGQPPRKRAPVSGPLRRHEPSASRCRPVDIGAHPASLPLTQASTPSSGQPGRLIGARRRLEMFACPRGERACNVRRTRSRRASSAHRLGQRRGRGSIASVGPPGGVNDLGIAARGEVGSVLSTSAPHSPPVPSEARGSSFPARRATGSRGVAARHANGGYVKWEHDISAVAIFPFSKGQYPWSIGPRTPMKRNFQECAAIHHVCVAFE